MYQNVCTISYENINIISKSINNNYFFATIMVHFITYIHNINIGV